MRAANPKASVRYIERFNVRLVIALRPGQFREEIVERKLAMEPVSVAIRCEAFDGPHFIGRGPNICARCGDCGEIGQERRFTGCLAVVKPDILRLCVIAHGSGSAAAVYWNLPRLLPPAGHRAGGLIQNPRDAGLQAGAYTKVLTKVGM